MASVASPTEWIELEQRRCWLSSAGAASLCSPVLGKGGAQAWWFSSAEGCWEHMAQLRTGFSNRRGFGDLSRFRWDPKPCSRVSVQRLLREGRVGCVHQPSAGHPWARFQVKSAQPAVVLAVAAAVSALPLEN